jgi:hypothetical protein
MITERFWKIVLDMRNGEKKSGIRLCPDAHENGLRERVWQTVKEKVGRMLVDNVRVFLLKNEDPEVQEYQVRCIEEGKAVARF